VHPTRRLLSAMAAAQILLLAGCVTNPYLPPPNVAAPPANATVLPGGLAYLVLASGSGSVHPTLDSVITVNYTGWTTDGHKFDSTINPDGSTSPATFPLGRLIQGWQTVLPLMVAGEKVRCWIPAKLGYGEHPAKPGQPAGMLVFDIQLISFK